MNREIGIPLESLLHLPILSGAKVIAGEAGLKRLVTSVNVMEVPDILEWVDNGQLLITTAYSLKNNLSELQGLLPKLKAVGVAGLGIKPKRYINEVPLGALAIANQLSFPIFEIPFNVSFSEIITEVLKQVMGLQTKALEEVHTLHQSLTSAMLMGGSLKNICDILYQRFGNSVAINSDFFSSFVVNAAPDKYQDIYKILHSAKQSITEQMRQVATSTYRVEGDRLGSVCCDRIVVPIYSDHILYGHICIWEDARKLNSLELSGIESVTSLIALEIMKKISLFEMENNHNSGFLENLLSADSRRHQRAVNNASLFDFNPDKAHQVIAISPLLERKDFKANGKAIFRLNTNVIGVLQSLVKMIPLKILYASHDHSIIILCELPDSGADSGTGELESFVKTLSQHLKREYLFGKVIIGVGRQYKQYSHLYKSRAEALRATSCAHKAADGIVFYEELGIYRLLSVESMRYELKLFYEDVLGALARYDAEKDTDLLKTLDMFFQCCGNTAQVSERMGVHYNTISYRLQRIRDLTGLSLDSAQDLLNLQIALKIREMRRHE